MDTSTIIILILFFIVMFIGFILKYMQLKAYSNYIKNINNPNIHLPGNSILLTQ